jgi:hypothetical protein
MNRKGLGQGKGSGYYNIIPRYDSYIHSLSAKGLKSCVSSKVKLNAKTYSYKLFSLDNEYSISCHTEDTRTGFRHIAVLLRNGVEVDRDKSVYYNRTWESYEYESVIHSLLTKHFPEVQAKVFIAKADGKPIRTDLAGNVYAKGRKKKEYSTCPKCGTRTEDVSFSTGGVDCKICGYAKVEDDPEKLMVGREGELDAKADLNESLLRLDTKINRDLLRVMTRRLNDGKITQERIFLGDRTFIVDKDLEKQGYDWLMDKWKTPKGKERKNNPFGNREQSVLEKFSHFELSEFRDSATPYAQQVNIHSYQPIWRVVSSNGNGFEYYMENGEPKIIG